ncbi:MAG: holo-ACP synthase [Candidatus Zixiibacteriota bacterium]
MVQAIGIDLVEIKRIESSLKKYGHRFVSRILGQDELATFDSRADKAAYLAGRFAAKEAIIKSLGRFLNVRPGYASLQILNDDSGNPYLAETGEAGQIFADRSCFLSISHERHYAAAVAVIAGNK